MFYVPPKHWKGVRISLSLSIHLIHHNGSWMSTRPGSPATFARSQQKSQSSKRQQRSRNRNPQIYSLLATIGAKGNDNVISFKTGPTCQSFCWPQQQIAWPLIKNSACLWTWNGISNLQLWLERRVKTQPLLFTSNTFKFISIENCSSSWFVLRGLQYIYNHDNKYSILNNSLKWDVAHQKKSMIKIRWCVFGYANTLLSLIILSWWKQALTTARFIVNIC